jgi:hypothetical protein
MLKKKKRKYGKEKVSKSNNAVESNTNKQEQVGKISGIEDKVDKLLHSENNKGKKSKHVHKL